MVAPVVPSIPDPQLDPRALIATITATKAAVEALTKLLAGLQTQVTAIEAQVFSLQGSVAGKPI